MRFSTAITVFSASAAIASPIANVLDKIQQLEKKALEWKYVTEVKVVTVTAGNLPKTPEPEPEPTTVVVKNTVFVNPQRVKPTTPTTLVKVSTSTPPPPPPPAPTTTSTPPAPVVEVKTEAPAPAPTTTSAPIVAAEKAAAPAAAASPTDFASTGTYWHNNHRKNHGASSVKWNSDLAASAQQLADTCHWGHDMSIGSIPYGQNIDTFGMSGTNAATSVPAMDKNVLLANAISNNWYGAEVGNYASLYGQANPQEGSAQFLHFTQMVWKGTTEVGCGIKFCGQNQMPLGSAYAWYVVCNYATPGNYANEYAKNVGSPQGLTVAKAAAPF